MSEQRRPTLPADAAVLLTEFLKLLSHELRSPLSVMASDLQYLATPDADRSVTSWKDALNRVTGSLNVIEAGAGEESEGSAFPASALINQIRTRVEASLLTAAETCLLFGNSSMIIDAVEELLLLHQAVTPPRLNLNSSQISLILIAPEPFPNRQSSLFVTRDFLLNPAVTPLKLWHAELVLRLSGAAFHLNQRELTIALPVHENSPNSVC